MTPRRRRMALVLGIVAGVSIAGALALSAFRQNVTFYFVPSEIAAGKVPVGQSIRLGGMVTRGSFQRVPGTLEVHFLVTDMHHQVPVTYDKVLPDLFREGAGVVAHGHLRSDGTFVADEVLAKHDEKYMPPKMGEALKTRRGEAREESPAGRADGAASGAGAAAADGSGSGAANAPQQVARPAAGS
jgi:cytochrome c-type biogenesis protein CcmE